MRGYFAARTREEGPAHRRRLVFRAGRGLTGDERERLAAMAGELDAFLSPAGPAEIAALVAPVLDQMIARPGVSDELAAAVYGEALAGLPRAALATAMSRIARGEADGISRRFRPTPAEIADLARQIAAPALEAARGIAALLDAPEEALPDAGSEAEREAQILNLAPFSAAAREIRARREAERAERPTGTEIAS